MGNLQVRISIHSVEKRGQTLRDPHKSTPAPAPVDVPRLAIRAQVSPRFFESSSRVRCAREKRGQTTFILRMAENGGRLRFLCRTLAIWN